MMDNAGLASILKDAHDRYFKGEARYIRTATGELAAEGDEFAGSILSEVESTMQLFEEHMHDEESILFAKIARAEKASVAMPDDNYLADYYGPVISTLIEQHDEVKPFLEKVIAWGVYLDHHNPKVAALSKRLVTFEVTLRAHIIIEEELLFARARELFKETGGAPV